MHYPHPIRSHGNGLYLSKFRDITTRIRHCNKKKKKGFFNICITIQIVCSYDKHVATLDHSNGSVTFFALVMDTWLLGFRHYFVVIQNGDQTMGYILIFVKRTGIVFSYKKVSFI